ncbi:MAG: hypothetical protein MZW92_28230 [Comamonadaceae bacterium]|nr:hypothetical protein [Comamonadaceae bacterium]
MRSRPAGTRGRECGEIELKFQVPEARRRGRAGVRSRPAAGAARSRWQARYVDTADGAWPAAGFALRLRREGRPLGADAQGPRRRR